jgi:hypothetical protein
MTSDFHKVISANDIFKQEVLDANTDFKQEVCDELSELRALLRHQQQLLSSSLNSVNSNQAQPPVYTSVSLSSNVYPSSIAYSSLPTTLSLTTDQVLLLLTDSFSKVATALTEKQTDSKAERPKFSGDSKKFCSWYLAIMMQLSITPWRDLYDSSNDDVVASTTNTTLNEKLYSKIILALDGTAL